MQNVEIVVFTVNIKKLKKEMVDKTLFIESWTLFVDFSVHCELIRNL